MFKFSDEGCFGGRLAVAYRSMLTLEGRLIATVREGFEKSPLTIIEMMVTYKGGVDSLTDAQMSLINRSRICAYSSTWHSGSPRVITRHIYDGWANEGDLYLLEEEQVNYMRGAEVGKVIREELSFRLVRINVDGAIESTQSVLAHKVNGLPRSIEELLRVCPDIEFSPSAL